MKSSNRWLRENSLENAAEVWVYSNSLQSKMACYSQRINSCLWKNRQQEAGRGGGEKSCRRGDRERERERREETERHTEKNRERQRDTDRETQGASEPWTGHFLDLSVEQAPLVLLRESVLPILEPTLLRILSISPGMFCFSSFSVSR